MFPLDLDVTWHEDYWYPPHPAHPSAVRWLREWRPRFLRPPSVAGADDRPIQEAVAIAVVDELTTWPR
jgi:hypothetical protein